MQRPRLSPFQKKKLLSAYAYIQGNAHDPNRNIMVPALGSGPTNLDLVWLWNLHKRSGFDGGSARLRLALWWIIIIPFVSPAYCYLRVWLTNFSLL